MRLVSWNVNGIRAAHAKGFAKWLAGARPDVLCVQEIKARPEQLEPAIAAPEGYRAYWFPAEKAGYSGVATFAREEPRDVVHGIGAPEFDSEGRVLSVEFDSCVVVNAYFPNSQREHARLPYKLAFCDAILAHCDAIQAKGKHVVLCGDYNIAHREIDLRNPRENRDNAGFLPEERAWMDRFLAAGYRDVFRDLHPGMGGHYTWWSYRPGVREKNIGWRLDYHCVDAGLMDRVASVGHQPGVLGSDHCPVELVLRD